MSIQNQNRNKQTNKHTQRVDVLYVESCRNYLYCPLLPLTTKYHCPTYYTPLHVHLQMGGS